jgi:hypothetical protein
MVAKEQYLANWLTKADNDLKIVGHEMANQDPVTDAVCFHCQQAVEKYLKAFLMEHDRECARTHNVDALLAECRAIDSAFNVLDLGNLNFFGVSIGTRCFLSSYARGMKPVCGHIRASRQLVKARLQK